MSYNSVEKYLREWTDKYVKTQEEEMAKKAARAQQMTQMANAYGAIGTLGGSQGCTGVAGPLVTNWPTGTVFPPTPGQVIPMPWANQTLGMGAPKDPSIKPQSEVARRLSHFLVEKLGPLVPAYVAQLIVPARIWKHAMVIHGIGVAGLDSEIDDFMMVFMKEASLGITPSPFTLRIPREIVEMATAATVAEELLK